MIETGEGLRTDSDCWPVVMISQQECLGKMLSMNSSLINLNVSSNQLGKDFFSRCVGPALGCNKTLKTLRYIQA